MRAIIKWLLLAQAASTPEDGLARITRNTVRLLLGNGRLVAHPPFSLYEQTIVFKVEHIMNRDKFEVPARTIRVGLIVKKLAEDL